MFDLPVRRRRRHILHIDADAFFASVEQVLNPALRGKAVLVGGPDDTKGIVSAASYEAKRCGVKTGMPMFRARKLCPHGIVVSGNFDAYRRVSRQMYEIFSGFTPDVEMASIDEAYLDITGYDEAYSKPTPEIAREILMKIYKDLGISASCGLSSNKTVSKTASSLNKPHKLTVVPFGRERDFLAPLPVGALPGIGSKTVEMLERRGLKLAGDVASLKIEHVLDKFGVHGIPIWKKCLGIDDSEVVSAVPLPKSISKEHTIYSGEDADESSCLKILNSLSATVFEKLRAHKMKAKNLYVKIRYKKAVFGSGFEDFVYSENLGHLMSADSQLRPVVKKLFLKNLDRSRDIRLIGVGVSGLARNYNMSLFCSTRSADRLFDTIDTIRRIHGKNGANFGSG